MAKLTLEQLEAQIATSLGLADTALQPSDNISELNNDSGFITDYTVTQGDVTTHQSALSITESQISDLGSYAAASHTHTESDITDLGTYLESVDIADINAMGTADGTTFLRGDGTWAEAGGGDVSVSGTPTAGNLTQWLDADTIEDSGVSVTSGIINEDDVYLGNATGSMVATPIGNIPISSFSDVDTDKSKTPADGDVLTFDGTDWNAEAASGGGVTYDHGVATVTGALTVNHNLGVTPSRLKIESVFVNNGGRDGISIGVFDGTNYSTVYMGFEWSNDVDANSERGVSTNSIVEYYSGSFDNTSGTITSMTSSSFTIDISGSEADAKFRWEVWA